ncbi:MAG: hypothetical protein K2Y02_12960, partial [Burkholderiaceae bacterium]|nr:hypothetical protein [Burkholderiaceae bacterium]
IKKKIELEPIELDDERPRREPRPERLRREVDEVVAEVSASTPPSPAREPRRERVEPSRKSSSDPFFDRPYEPSATASPAWEAATPAVNLSSARATSPNIKPKRRVAALFGEKMHADQGE